jgi:hypothetical protein
MLKQWFKNIDWERVFNQPIIGPMLFGLIIVFLTGWILSIAFSSSSPPRDNYYQITLPNGNCLTSDDDEDGAFFIQEAIKCINSDPKVGGIITQFSGKESGKLIILPCEVIRNSIIKFNGKLLPESYKDKLQ